jgi:hypothetical protein
LADYLELRVEIFLESKIKHLKIGTVVAYSNFQVNEPHYFYLTQRRKGAKEENKKQDCGLNT